MPAPEDIQLRIMRQLLSPGSLRWDIRESYSKMAEKLGVDEETVRRGINRAQKMGFLRDVQLILNPRLVHRQLGGLHVDVGNPHRKPTVNAQLRNVDGVTMILDLIGTSLGVNFYYENNQTFQKTVDKIRDICESNNVVEWRGEFPPCNLNLRRTDWEIIRALRDRPRRKTSEIAEKVGVSMKTVRRRLAIMTEGKAFYLMREINYENYPGVPASILTTASDPTKKAQIDKQILAKLGRLIFSSTDQKEFSKFGIVFLNMSEADDTLRWIQDLVGVRSARMDLIREVVLPREYLDREIQAHIEGAEREALPNVPV